VDCPDQAIVHLGSAEATVTLCGCSHQAVLAGAVKKARTVGTMRALQARHATIRYRAASAYAEIGYSTLNQTQRKLPDRGRSHLAVVEDHPAPRESARRAGQRLAFVDVNCPAGVGPEDVHFGVVTGARRFVARIVVLRVRHGTPCRLAGVLC
jgi:hypothetical protein